MYPTVTTIAHSHIKQIHVVWLSCNEHGTRLVNKVSRQLGLLSRVRNSLTVNTAERIFKAMILPKLDYCHFA